MLDKQNENQDALYEEKLHIMENLRKSFEVFCSATAGGGTGSSGGFMAKEPVNNNMNRLNKRY